MDHCVQMLNMIADIFIFYIYLSIYLWTSLYIFSYLFITEQFKNIHIFLLHTS